MHSRTTAREILADFEGERLDYWVTGYGTGGTLKGVARVLREQRPETKIVVCEPDNSPILGSGIAQPRARRRRAGGEPSDLPAAPDAGLDARLHPEADRRRAGAEARRSRRARRRRRGACGCRASWRSKEGIFAGISGGATLRGRAARSASRRAEGATVLCMLPDTGERYLSTPLFDGIAAEMTEEELAISRLDAELPLRSAAPPPVAPARGWRARRRREPRSSSRSLLDDPEQPGRDVRARVVRVLLVGAQAVRAVQGALPLDRPRLGWSCSRTAAGQRSARRSAARTGSPTIPQIFVGGEFIGGAFEVLDAFRGGPLPAAAHRNHRVPFDPERATRSAHAAAGLGSSQRPAARLSS